MAAEAQPVILTANDGGIVTVTLNRPRAMNALSAELRNAIVRTFEALQQDERCDVVILTGAGKAFCAGLDLKELGGEVGNAAVGQRIAIDTDIHRALLQCEKPIIGAINGVAITGGFELALMCDVLIASTNARFADTHARVGIIPGWGLSVRLPRLIGISRAKEVSLTGNFVDAVQAERWGLVNHVLAPEELLPFCQRLARDMQSCDRRTMLGYKKLIDEGFALSFDDAIIHEDLVSRLHSTGVRPEDVAERRKAIQERGRAQV